MRDKTINYLLISISVVVILIIIVFNQKNLGASVTDNTVGLDIGDTAPDFELQSFSGEIVHLSDYREKPVLLNFWASWCPTCRAEMPDIQNIHEEGELVVLGVNLQEKNKKIEEFKNKFQLTFPLLLDPDSEVKKMYNVYTQPVTYIINKRGKIVDKRFGPMSIEEIRKKIPSLLQIEVKTQEDEIKTLPDGTKYIVDPSKILSGGPPKDGIPPIDNPKFVSVEEADEWLDDDELILALVYKEIKRVYPLQIMVWHEIVNDIVAENPILITYCPLCGSGIAFERKINGEEVGFGTSGKLYNSNLIMYDRKTSSYWTQIGGKAIVGELAGMRLKTISLDTVKWGDWKEQHPNSEVLSKETEYSRNYGTDPYGDYYENKNVMFSVENENRIIHPKTVVFGIEVGGVYKAYKEEDLIKLNTIKDTLNGVNIIIQRDNAGVVTISNTETGEKIIKERDFWFAWYAFYPDTLIYDK